jgi:hypothetical protein
MRQAVVLVFVSVVLCALMGVTAKAEESNHSGRFALVSDRAPVCNDLLTMLNAPENADYDIGEELTIPEMFRRRYVRPDWKPLAEEEWVNHLHSSEIAHLTNKVKIEIAEFHMDQLPGPNTQFVLRWNQSGERERPVWSYKISAKTYLYFAAYLSFNRMIPSKSADIILQYPESTGVMEGIGYETYLLASDAMDPKRGNLILYTPNLRNGKALVGEKDKDNVWPQMLFLTKVCKFTQK